MPEPGARVDGLFEAHLNVESLGRSLPFYRDVVGLELAYELPERGVAFFWCGEAGGSMLGLWEQGSMPMAMRLHVAFAASLEEVLAAPGRLATHGVTPLSLYLAMLDEPSRPERGIVPWSEWARPD